MKRGVTIWVFLVCGLSFLLQTANAAPGDLDVTFSSDGVVASALGRGGDDGFNATAVQADGRIVVAGSARYGYRTYCSVSRYNSDGTPDMSFGAGGRSIVIINDVFTCRAVAIQADGKIVAAGSAEIVAGASAAAIVRFNGNGSLDTTFDGDGRLVLSAKNVTAMGLQPDGKIVAVGYSGSSGAEDFEAFRFNDDGSADFSFGVGGRAGTPVMASGDVAYAMAIQPDGRIVLAGYSWSPTNQDFAVVRFNTDGTLDTTFDTDGRVTTPILTADVAYAVAIQPDGRIIAAGYSSASSDRFSLVRYMPDGSLDSSFDGDGKLVASVDNIADQAYAVAVEANGKILVAGGSRIGSRTNVSVIRLNSDGAFDLGFDGDGKVTTALSSFYDLGSALALQSDGRIVVAGYGRSGTVLSNYNNDSIIVRYNTDGSPDSSFDADGKLSADNGVDQSASYAVAHQSDGKIVAAGYCTENLRPFFGVARYNADGSPDTTFDGDGKISTAVRSGSNIAYAIAVQPDGKIIVAGNSNTDGLSDYDFALVRYNADGSLDTSFDGDGMVTTAFLNPDNHDQPTAIAIQPDGKIVVAGFSTYSTGGEASLFARYNADGALDTSFDGDGKLTLFDQGLNAAHGVAIQPDGKIVAGGYVGGGGYDFAAIRLNTNGTFDKSFDGDGRARIPVRTGDDFAYTMALQPDGRIVLAGRSVTNSNEAGALVRLNPNGSPDTSFDEDGKMTTFTPSRYESVAVQADGKIIGSRGGLIRIMPNGEIDNTFGTGGRTTFTNFGTWQVSFDASGKAVVSGSATDGIFGVARVITTIVREAAMFDFDGDGKSDPSVYRPSNGVWYLLNSSSGFSAYQFGVTTDALAPADYTGDGKTDLAVWRPSTGIWYVLRSENNTFYGAAFGMAGDISVPGDYDGDGRGDLAVIRPGATQSFWYLQQSSAGFNVVPFGLAGDVPTRGDFDGDGKTDVAVYRPTAGAWFRFNSSNGSFLGVGFGQSGDKVVPADYTGDGKTDLAVFRPSNSVWYILRSEDYSLTGGAFGASGDIPSPGDYDGDGKTDVAVWRPGPQSVFYLQQSTAGFNAIPWGLGEDKPVPGAYVY